MARLIEILGFMNGVGILCTFFAYRWKKAKKWADKMLKIEEEEKREAQDQGRPETPVEKLRLWKSRLR